MNRTSKVWHRTYIWTGLTITGGCGTIALAQYTLKGSLLGASGSSAVLLLSALLAGCTLTWIGVRAMIRRQLKKLDRGLESHLSYRICRWVVRTVFKVVVFVICVALDAWTGRRYSASSPSFTDTSSRSGDDVWDLNPKYHQDDERR